MALVGHRGWAVNDMGNVQPAAAVEVRRVADNSLASLFTDDTGGTPVANPTVADAEGSFEFYLEPDRYTLLVGSGASQETQPLNIVDGRAQVPFESRADFVAWVAGGGVAADGTIKSDGTVQYVASAGATAIADMPGWLPFGLATSDHYGIPKDNTGDVGADLQSAIAAAAAAGFVRFRLPAGTYRTTTAITVTTPVNIEGDGPAQTVLMVNSTTESGFVFRPTNLDGSLLGESSISGVKITHPDTNATSGWALEVRSCINFRCEDFSFSNVANGILNSGGTSNDFSSINGASQQGGLRSGSALVRFQPQDIGGGSYQFCYNHRFSSFNLSGGTGKTAEDVFDLRGVDGLQIENGHANFGDRSLVKVEPLADGAQSNVTAVDVSGVYFDGAASAAGTDYGAYIPDEAVTGQISRLTFRGCFFGNYAVSSVYGRATGTGRVSFEGCNFSNTQSALVDLNLDSAETSSNWTFSDCLFRDSAAGGLVATDVNSLQVKDCNFFKVTGATGAINLSGAIDSFHLVGSTFKGNTSDLVDSATILEKVVSGCSGGVFNSGSSTPTVSFGGGSTGVTYSTQTCAYRILEGLVYFRARIQLTSKGTSTGNFVINLNLPSFLNASGNTAIGGFKVSPLTSNSTDRAMAADVVGGTSQIRISEYGAAGTDILVQFTDANIQDNTLFDISGVYDFA